MTKTAGEVSVKWSPCGVHNLFVQGRWALLRALLHLRLFRMIRLSARKGEKPVSAVNSFWPVRHAFNTYLRGAKFGIHFFLYGEAGSMLVQTLCE